MPAPVYTERFLYAIGAKDYSWQVPVDMRAVITCITLVNSLAAAGNACIVYVHGVPIFRRYPVEIWTEYVSMRVCVYQDETIRLITVGTNMYATVSGYCFRDDSGRDAPPGLTKPATAAETELALAAA